MLVYEWTIYLTNLVRNAMKYILMNFTNFLVNW